MLIHSLRKEYAVLRILKATRDIDISVCRDSSAKKEQARLIITMKNPDLIYRLMPFFVEQRKNNAAFQDFQECFAQDGKLYLVFAWREKPLLFKKIAEGDYSFRERLEIGKNLLSFMVLQQIPDCIQYDVLQEGNLLLDDALQVYFNYQLENIAGYFVSTGSKALDDALQAYFSYQPEDTEGCFAAAGSMVQPQLARIFRKIFRAEIDAQSAEELPAFIKELERGSFADYLDIYQAYDRLYDLLKNRHEQGQMEPQSFLFRLWERIKGLARWLKPALAVIVLAMAFGYLVYTATNPNSVAASANSVTINSIGTVEIEMPEPEQTPAETAAEEATAAE
jgi:hypothetical protein